MDKTKKKVSLPLVVTKAVANAINLGAGFYVGFMDGQRNPVDPATRYILLATPSVLSGAFCVTSCYGIQKLLKFCLENDKAGFENNLEKKLTEEDINFDGKKVQEVLNKIAYTDITPMIPEMFAVSAGKTALKTGIGYTIGFGLAKLL